MTIGEANRVILLALLIWGQSICDAWAIHPITGVVRNQKTQAPVAGAFILAFSDNIQKGFAFSDAEGKFSIQIQDDATIDTIKVTMMGYAPVSISPGSNTDGLIIELKEQAIQLTPSAVKTNRIQRKGDTLSFYVQSFADGTELVLDDLINKIPGVSTNEQGTISFNGEAINRFYIEDLDLMGSKYGIVTRNLKATDIARVDIYLNHQPVNALREISPSERSAVNIVLKDDAHGSWVFTGDAFLGLLPFPLFNAKAMLTHFDKSKQDLFLVKGNNIGNDISQELRQQTGIYENQRVILLGSGVDEQLSSPLDPSFSSLPIPKQYWYDNLSGLASFNHLAKTSESAKLRFSINVAAESYAEQAFSSETVTFDDGSEITINDQQSQTDRKYYFLGQSTYENNGTDRFLSETLSLSGQIRSNIADGWGRDNYNQLYDLPSFKAENDLRITRRYGKTAVNYTSTAIYLRNAHSATYNTGGRTYEQSYIQNDLTTNHTASIEIIAGRHSLSAKASVDLDYLDRDATLTTVSKIAGTKGELSLFSTSPSLTIRDVIRLGSNTLIATLPVALNILQIKGKAGIVYPTLSPTLSFRCTPTAKLTAIAVVGYSLRRSSPESLLDATIMRNYRTLSRSDSLSRNDRFSIQTSLRYADPVEMLFINLKGSIGRTIRSKTPSNKYYSELTVIEYAPVQNSAYSYSAEADIRKYFGGRTLMLEGTAEYDKSEMDHYLQQVFVHYDTRILKLGGSFSTNPVNWFSLKCQVGYNRQITTSGYKAIVSHILTGEGSMRISPFQKMDIILDGYIRHERIPNVAVFNKPLIKASVSWRFSKGTAYLECNNLFNITEYSRETVNAYRTLSTVNHLRGRMFLAGFMMSF